MMFFAPFKSSLNWSSSKVYWLYKLVEYFLIFVNGSFSYLYDSSHRNGNLVVPFRSDKNAHMKRMIDNQGSYANKSFSRKNEYSNKLRLSGSHSPPHK